MAEKALDYKKQYKDLYGPGPNPAKILVPPISYIMVDGQGDPNDPAGNYQAALQLLYALSFTIKMSKKTGSAPADYFEYVVPPLEGLWQGPDGTAVDYQNKGSFTWTSMIRQPEFVTADIFAGACEAAAQKKKIDTSPARFAVYDEGLCVQCMHTGPYDDEPATLEKIHTFIKENHLAADYTERRHHEIYLSDPRKTAPERLRTVLRIPVKEL